MFGTLKSDGIDDTLTRALTIGSRKVSCAIMRAEALGWDERHAIYQQASPL